MLQLKERQTQELTSASGSETASTVSPQIDEKEIADSVLGVRRAHRKGVGRIIKGKGKVSASYVANLSSMAQSQQSVEERFNEKFNAQQREIEMLKGIVASMRQQQQSPQLPPSHAGQSSRQQQDDDDDDDGTEDL